MEVAQAYERHSGLEFADGAAEMDLAADLRRTPVSFRGTLRDPLLMRQMLGALHRVVRGDYRWKSEAEWLQILDPVITVHPDQVFFEAFSNDQSVYARLSAPLTAFRPEGEVAYGTTNVDFTQELGQALQGLRSSRRTGFSVGAQGFGVRTRGPGAREHFERKVDVPEGWIRGFLRVQAALAAHPYVFDVRPVDLLSVTAFLREHKPPRPPHGLRYEMRPGQPIRVVLEPWEQEFVLQGTSYRGQQRTVRVWGRRRLELLESVLPWTERLSVGLLGRGLPHFYVCHGYDGHRFVLALSGWTGNDWSQGSAFELMTARLELDAELIEAVHAHLGRALIGSKPELAAALDRSGGDVEHALLELCRAGRVMYDPADGRYRLRELFPEALDLRPLLALDPRIEAGWNLVEAGAVELLSVEKPETGGGGRREHRAEAVVQHEGPRQVRVCVDLEGRLRFGRCSCEFFQNHLMSRGPCEHILAARLALDRRLHGGGQEAITGPMTDGGSTA